MKPWTVLGEAPVPGSDQTLRLARRGEGPGAEFSIRLMQGGGNELMNSRQHTSEDRLAEWGCAALHATPNACVLVGGLGMGFTLAAALKVLAPSAQVTVAELVPQVVEWNRAELGSCAAWPLQDPRTRVVIGDVAALIRAGAGGYHAIILDVDNGPDGLSAQANDRLYSSAGLLAAYRALHPGGTLGIWSAAPDRHFGQKLKQAGFVLEQKRSRSHAGSGAWHTIWLGHKRA